MLSFVTILLLVSVGSTISRDGIGESFPNTKEPLQNWPSQGFVQAPLSAPSTVNDTVPPSWPQGSNLTAVDMVSSALVLTWTPAVDDVGIASYRVNENGVYLHAVQGNVTAYYVTGLVAGTKYDFNILAGDAAGLWSANNLSLTVTTPMVNQPPVLTVPGTQTARAGSSLTFTVIATDPDVPTEAVSLSASGLPAGASFPPASGNPAVQTFSWAIPTSQASGNYTISFAASDISRSPSSVARSVLIQVTRALQAPTLEVPGPQTINAGTLLAFAVVPVDPNLPPFPVSVEVAGLPIGATFNPVSGVFAWTPAGDQSPGVYIVVFTASDGQDATITKKVSIDVIGSSEKATTQPGLPEQGLFWLAAIPVGILIVLVPWTLISLRGRRKAKKEAFGRGEGDRDRSESKTAR